MNTLVHFEHESGEQTYHLFKDKTTALNYVLAYLEEVWEGLFDEPVPESFYKGDLTDEEKYEIVKEYVDRSNDECFVSEILYTVKMPNSSLYKLEFGEDTDGIYREDGE